MRTFYYTCKYTPVRQGAYSSCELYRAKIYSLDKKTNHISICVVTLFSCSETDWPTAVLYSLPSSFLIVCPLWNTFICLAIRIQIQYVKVYIPLTVSEVLARAGSRVAHSKYIHTVCMRLVTYTDSQRKISTIWFSHDCNNLTMLKKVGGTLHPCGTTPYTGYRIAPNFWRTKFSWIGLLQIFAEMSFADQGFPFATPSLGGRYLLTVAATPCSAAHFTLLVELRLVQYCKSGIAIILFPHYTMDSKEI